MMREHQKGCTQEQAAAKANLRSRQTAAKYLQAAGVPPAPAPPREYSTRPDPFAADWAEVETMLTQSPTLEAKALFEWLDAQHPGRYQAGQLRTFQRHVATWRGLHQEQEASLEQLHRPGEVLQTDGVWFSELHITLQGEAFPHLVIHSVLPYSNWEWGVIAHSESLAALQAGLESTLAHLGAVPEAHQTDHSTAATHTLSAAEQAESDTTRGYNVAYLALLAHYGLAPRTTHVRRPQENGDVEAGNGGLRRAVEQQLLLRGSRDFASLAAYTTWLQQVFTHRNQPRQVRLTEELAVMRPLTVAPLGSLHQLRVRVTHGSLIRVDQNSYSVPTHLIGQWVTVQVCEWEVLVYYARRRVATLPRLVGVQQHHINYRHVIASLLRKPGGFRDYRYRDDLFPSLVFRQAWERLQTWYAPRQADLHYLHILHLAARTLESAVAAALTTLLAGDQPWDEATVERLVAPPPPALPALTRAPVDLQVYDRLLTEVYHDAA
jgi:hypothetical protein